VVANFGTALKLKALNIFCDSYLKLVVEMSLY
jgi:hypothetical protein